MTVTIISYNVAGTIIIPSEKLSIGYLTIQLSELSFTTKFTRNVQEQDQCQK